MFPARFEPQFSESVLFRRFPALFRRFPPFSRPLPPFSVLWMFHVSNVFPGLPLFFSWQQFLLYSLPLPFGKMLQMPKCNAEFQCFDAFCGHWQSRWQIQPRRSYAPSFRWCYTVEIWKIYCTGCASKQVLKSNQCPLSLLPILLNNL